MNGLEETLALLSFDVGDLPTTSGGNRSLSTSDCLLVLAALIR